MRGGEQPAGMGDATVPSVRLQDQGDVSAPAAETPSAVSSDSTSRISLGGGETQADTFGDLGKVPQASPIGFGPSAPGSLDTGVSGAELPGQDTPTKVISSLQTGDYGTAVGQMDTSGPGPISTPPTSADIATLNPPSAGGAQAPDKAGPDVQSSGSPQTQGPSLISGNIYGSSFFDISNAFTPEETSLFALQRMG